MSNVTWEVAIPTTGNVTGALGGLVAHAAIGALPKLRIVTPHAQVVEDDHELAFEILRQLGTTVTFTQDDGIGIGPARALLLETSMADVTVSLDDDAVVTPVGGNCRYTASGFFKMILTIL